MKGFFYLLIDFSRFYYHVTAVVYIISLGPVNFSFLCVMPLYISSLNSGSNGNCYYIGNDDEAVLVDAGLSCRETQRRMNRLGLDIKNVKAIFVSHEHTDHVKGLASLAEKFSLPVYVTDATARRCYHLQPSYKVNLSPHIPVHIGSLSITAFPKFHDAADPHSFIISGNGYNVGVFTDIGAPCDQLIKYFKICHAAFLEANYDEEMLEKGNYPSFLKNRIRGGKGHLSNAQALALFMNYRTDNLSHLFLSHLSEKNNCPDLVKRIFEENKGNTEIVVAGRYAETALYKLENITYSLHSRNKINKVPRTVQMSLF